ncbi:Cyclin-like [Parasponia andersonii]|uniref:Cyclin-like n=1 Tax=Parasponia andersonii TaxID=3476 RepID=A0A2P5AP58_PARAD|nr:Cyclin-like [Parasponia andersonii]
MEKFRSRALLVIFKYSKCENFDPRVPYLAMNLFDQKRFTGNLISKWEPSVIAASAILAACSYMYPEQFQSFRDQIISEGIIEERQAKRCLHRMIELCQELKLMVESNHVRKRRVRAGAEPEQVVDEQTSTQMERSRQLDFQLKWKIREVLGEKYVIFHLLSESAKLDQLAQEASDESPDSLPQPSSKMIKGKQVQQAIPEPFNEGTPLTAFGLNPGTWQLALTSVRDQILEAINNESTRHTRFEKLMMTRLANLAKI